MIYIELNRIPRSCNDCAMLLKIHGKCAYCMSTGMQIKYSETDLRDGMCPIKIESGKIETVYEWARLGENAMVCGKCGKGLQDSHGYGFALYEFDYFPFCGAKMNKREYKGGVPE